MMAVQWEGELTGSQRVRPDRQRCSGCRELFPIEKLRRRGAAIALWCDMCASQTVLFSKPRKRSGGVR